MLHWPSPPLASIGPRRSSSTTAWKAGGKIGRMPTGRVRCLRTSPGPASSVGIIENGKLQRTSCTQGSSLACPWLSRLSTGTPDSAKPWDVLFLLVSLYFDDAHLTDWSPCKGSGQQAFRGLNEIMAPPLPKTSARTWRPLAHSWGWTLTSVGFLQMVQLPSGFGRGFKRKSRTCWPQRNALGCCPQEWRPSSMVY